MPWRPNKNGDNKYFVSIYAKEELPTWAEIYEECYQKEAFIYDPNDKNHLDLDLYWNIPRLKYILATVCNQFNKMIFEDGMKKDLIQFINSEIHDKCTDVRFTCEPIEDFDPSNNSDKDLIMEYETFVIKWKAAFDSQLIGNESPPPIYTISLPNGKLNPFIISKHIRKNINAVHIPMCLFPIIKFNNNSNDYSIYTPLPYRESSYEDYHKIIDFMMRPIKEYFEGSGVGWKDHDGNLIESDPMKRSCDGAGYDPAL